MSDDFSSLDPDCRYFSQDLFDDTLPFNIDVDDIDEENPIIDVPIFREGKYRHYWYGTLDFNTEYLQKIIDNHYRRVNPQRVSLNADHIASRGAYGWIAEDEEDKPAIYMRPLTFMTPEGKVTKNYLFCRWRLNKKGLQAVKDKEYAYFSAEIHDDFSTPEIKENANGDDTQVKYGATLTGCALTNRPFIPNLPGMFSNGVKPDPSRYEMSIHQDENTKTWLYFAASKPVEDNKPKSEGDPMLDKFRQEFSSATNVDEKIRIANQYSSNPECSAEAGIYLNLLNEQKAKEIALNKSVKEAEANQRALNSALEQKAELELSLRKQKESSFQDRVKALSTEFGSSDHYPAVVNRFSELCSKLSVEAREFNLGDEGGEAKFSILDFAKELLDAIPEEGRMNYNDDVDPDPEKEVPIHPPADPNEYNNDGNEDGQEDGGNEDETMEQLFARFEEVDGGANGWMDFSTFEKYVEEGKISRETADFV